LGDYPTITTVQSLLIFDHSAFWHDHDDRIEINLQTAHLVDDM